MAPGKMSLKIPKPARSTVWGSNCQAIAVLGCRMARGVGEKMWPGYLFSSTPLAILQPRTAIAWQFEPQTVLRAGFGIFSDILPGAIADVVGVNPPYVSTFQGGLLGTVGGTAIAPGVPGSAVDAAVAANQIFHSGFSQGELSCASAQSNPV